METLVDLIDWILHLDDHLQRFTRQHGGWVYALLFVIIFCETGLVVTPFLPGDSLLYRNIPLVERHFHLVLVGVLGVSLMPLVFEVARARLLRRPACSGRRAISCPAER